MLKLNSISQSIFNADDVKDNSTIKVNSAGTSQSISRKEIIATGRLVACEYFGNLVNKNPLTIEKYNSRIKDANFDYATLSKKFREKQLMFCATKVCSLYDKDAPATFDDFKRDCMSYAQDKIFMKMLSEIDREIISPIFFDVIDSVGMGLVQMVTSPLGATKEITVRSNDVFLYEDGSWGSSRSTSKNYLYSKTITLNPKVHTCNATIKWYQDYVDGDAGWYFGALVNGMYNKMYAKLISAMDAASAGGAYIPEGLTAPTYSTANYIRITDLVAASNGVRVDDLMAIGTRSALSNLLPVDGNGGAITGLQYGLGESWFQNGYLPKAAGVDLFPVSPVIVPGTQNSTLQTIDTGDNIYIFSKGGYGYKPIYTAVAEGSPIILTTTPSGGNENAAMGTADFTIDINVSAIFDTKPVFASKVGVIKSVYPTT